MRQPHLILVTGLPGTGKSTLARVLARHFAVPLIGKDAIKEPLFDVIGALDRHDSRRLSDASFAVSEALNTDDATRRHEHQQSLIDALSAWRTG